MRLRKLTNKSNKIIGQVGLSSQNTTWLRHLETLLVKEVMKHVHVIHEGPQIMPQTFRLNIREVSYFEGLNVDGVDAVNAHSERNDQQQGPPVKGLWLKVKRPFLSLWTALAGHGHLSPDTGTSPGLALPAWLLTLFLWSRGRRWGREEGWKREIRRVKVDYLSAFLMKSG